MGSPDSEDERDSDETQHSVTLTEGFWMGETEVSQLLWEEVMDGNNPSKFPKKDDTTAKSDDYPVDSVSWNDCQEFLKEINRKYPVNGFEWCLPTEAQWEYACRAGSSTPFFWGDSLKGGDKANCCGEFPYGTKTKGYYRESTVPVHRFVPNAWDLYNMYGNVLEWCLDWYGTYPNGDTVNPTGQPSGFARVLRGGAWGSRAHRCRSACRTRSEPDTRYSTFGLRVTLVPVQSNITRDSF
jgi:formylglycine-generating enzyme required for sulfatase activity